MDNFFTTQLEKAQKTWWRQIRGTEKSWSKKTTSIYEKNRFERLDGASHTSVRTCGQSLEPTLAFCLFKLSMQGCTCNSSTGWVKTRRSLDSHNSLVRKLQVYRRRRYGGEEKRDGEEEKDWMITFRKRGFDRAGRKTRFQVVKECALRRLWGLLSQDNNGRKLHNVYGTLRR